MKKILIALVCCCCQWLPCASQQISAAEYFFDADPGIGNATPLTITPGVNPVFTTTIQLGSLTPGFHFLSIRTKSTGGEWGLMESRGFYVSTQTENINAIVAAEYFLDTDPGVGNATTLTVPTGLNPVFSAAIPLGSLTPGFHFLCIRTKDINGQWGMIENRGFYFTAQGNNAGDITAAEYYFDTDPGIGNGFPININVTGSFYKDSLLLPVGALPEGNHRFVIRVRNADGHWSMLENKLFKICSQYGPLSKMAFHIESNQVFFSNLSSYNDTTLWKFGDGTTDTILHPIKTYASAGNYNLQLISRNACASDTLSHVIRIMGIHSINAAKGGNKGIATVIFEGNGFTASTVLKLQKNGSLLLPENTQYISSKRIVGYFNLTDVETGQYHVIADLGGGPLDTLKNGFVVSEARYPDVVANDNGRNPARFGMMRRSGTLQNLGNEDAIMISFASVVGYRPGTITLSPMVEFVELANQGIFQHTFQYINSNGISTDVMNAADIDTSRKKQMLAYYRVKVPSESYVNNAYKVTNNFGLLGYDNRYLVQPPLFKSSIVLNDISSPAGRDCMNSFLKKAVKKNVSANISDVVWNNCFNIAFDTLARSVRDIVRDISQQQKSIPMKSVFSSLLVQMLECGGTGLPASITSVQFQKIIKDVTYNWLFLENLDSIGKPCFDTTDYVFNQRAVAGNERGLSGGRLASDDCPGAQFFEELGELCKNFNSPCDAVKDLLFKDDDLYGYIGRKVFDKLTGFLGPAGSKGFCGVNSATAGCKALCEMTSVDPNVKFGPGNNDTKKHINFLSDHAYSIHFENLASATAPAAYVEIIDTIDKARFDLATFQTGAFGWGDSLVVLDANRGNFSMLKNLEPTHPNKLRVDVRIDTATGIASWKFYTLDPITLQLTDDPAQGFLPPNTDGVRGSGFVSFSVKPKSGVTSGDVIDNSASIIFDQNAAITTPVWQHIIDTTKPVSHVAALPATTLTNDFTVNWGGTDVHAGMNKYAIYVSVNDSLYKQWMKFTTDVSATFTGVPGKHYKFFSIAMDLAGNYEEPPSDPYASPDASTSIDIVVPVSLTKFDVKKSTDEKKAIITWLTATEQGVSHFEIQRSLDGENFSSIGRMNARNIPNGASYHWVDVSPAKGINFYRLKIIDLDASNDLSATRSLRFDGAEVLVFPTYTSSLVFIKSGERIQAQLINQLGEVLLTKEIINTVSFDLSSFAPGVYFLKIPGRQKQFKVVKQ